MHVYGDNLLVTKYTCTCSYTAAFMMYMHACTYMDQLTKASFFFRCVHIARIPSGPTDPAYTSLLTHLYRTAKFN